MVYAQVNYGLDSLWTVNNGQFRGTGSVSTNQEIRTLTLRNSLDLSSYAPGTVSVDWTQSKSNNLESDDLVYYSLSGDSGATWSNPDNTTWNNPIDLAQNSYGFTIPDAYLTSNFQIRFYFTFNATTNTLTWIT